MSLLDEHLPRWHHRERHTVAYAGPPGDALAAFDALTWREVPLFRVLMGIRSLGTTSRTADRRILTDFTGIGFTLTGTAPDEVVYAGIGRPWSPRGGMRRVESVTGFRAFDEPGWAKMAMNVAVAVTGAGAGTELTTETRVWLTSPSARRSFATYWLVIRPFSGLIRRSWLTASVRRAEVIHRG